MNIMKLQENQKIDTKELLAEFEDTKIKGG